MFRHMHRLQKWANEQHHVGVFTIDEILANIAESERMFGTCNELCAAFTNRSYASITREVLQDVLYYTAGGYTGSNRFLLDKNDENYYRGHFPRFILQYSMLEAIAGGIRTAREVGSWRPMSSVVLANEGVKVEYGCEQEQPSYYIGNTEYQQININQMPNLAPVDIVICTEVLEHLPVNLYAVRDWLVGQVNIGGYILLSFPTGNIVKGGYGDTLPLSVEQTYGQHLREFPGGEAMKFVNEIKGFSVIHSEPIKTPLYLEGVGILHVLLKRDGVAV